MIKLILISIGCVAALLLIIFIFVCISAISTIINSLSGGYIGSSLKIEKRERYKKYFLTRLFHRHEWEPKIDSNLKYSKEKICYVCGKTK